MNENLLLDIFHIPAPSGKENEIYSFIIKYLTYMEIPFATDDKSGTIFNVSNKDRPLLSAHMDTVQREADCDLAKFIKIKNGLLYGYGVIGGDDKCGIYIILELLKKYKDLNFAFFRGEEIGCIGSKEFSRNVKDFSNVLYGLVLDRRNNCDIICNNNSYGTLEFEKELENVGKEFGYKSATGTISDANTLREFFSCANLSVGYKNPHMNKEYVVLEDLQKAYDFVEKIITTIVTKFAKAENKIPITTYRYGKGYDYSAGYDYGDYADDYWKGKSKTASNWATRCDLCFTYSGDDRTYLKSLNKYACKACLKKIADELINLDADGIFEDDIEEVKTADDYDKDYPSEADIEMLEKELSF